MREAEGFGTEVIYPEDGVPYAKCKRIQTYEEIDTLKVVDPASVRRMNDRLEAVHFLKQRAAKEVPVVGWVEGALAESCDLMDMQNFFIMMLEEPELAEQLLDICLEQGLLFAKAQIEAGADIIGIGDAASSLIGPSLYERFALPYQKKLISGIQQMGAKTKLHICGDLNPVLPLVGQTGADIIDLDYMVDMEAAADLFPDTVSFCGNIAPVDVLYSGTAELVRKEVRRCLGIADRTNSMISSGCEIPCNTSAENVLAMHEEIVKAGRYGKKN